MIIIKTFTLRLPDDLHDLLTKKAEEANLSKNDYLKMLLENEKEVIGQQKILDEIKGLENLLISVLKSR